MTDRLNLALCLAVASSCIVTGCGPEDDVGSRLLPVAGLCTVEVQGKGNLHVEDDYLPHVIACEHPANGLETLKAQALASRTYAYYKVTIENKALKDGTGDQVYSCAGRNFEQLSATTQANIRAAVAATAGQVLTYNGSLIAAFFVAGSSSTSSSCRPSSSTGSTERYVTYNEGNSGSNVTPTSLGSTSNPRNRGCLSQLGSTCLETIKGYNHRQIVEFYYGADIVISGTTGACGGNGSGTGNPGTCVPQPETCNNRDDDCNGLVDDGNPGGGAPCSTGLPGVCAQGVLVCSGGQLNCQPTVAPSAEVCDGQDNDCNDQVDDNCSNCQQPRSEICNGYDDDCNGRVDDGDPGGGTFCSTNLLGECQRGVSSCQGGRLVCVPLKQPEPEICDGRDNDCDGQIDEDAGCSTSCLPGAPEICNGIDDNCSGGIDEGNPGGGQTCLAAGACPVGITVCQGGQLTCLATPSAEICDGLDNDCNGVVDDVIGGCQQSCTPSPEVCNGRDDDCDGFPDDGNPGGGAPCVLAGSYRGIVQCVRGQLVCWPASDGTLEGSAGCSIRSRGSGRIGATVMLGLALALAFWRRQRRH